MIWKQLRPAIVLTIALMLITGLVYPGIVTGLARVLFPAQAAGSLVTVDGRVAGSRLIGQTFEQPWYFHPRPSAAGDGYDASASSGTNKGPTDLKLADTMLVSAIESAERDGAMKGRIPSDMVTASASGLDPHISPANAALQVARVSAARGADAARVNALVARHTEGRQFGIFGDPRVNVFELNVALDKEIPRQQAAVTPIVTR